MVVPGRVSGYNASSYRGMNTERVLLRVSEQEVGGFQAADRMLQQLTITLESEVPLRELVKSALQSQAQVLEVSLRRTRQQVVHFEQQYGMSSAEFERRLAAREIDETLDFIDWQGELALLNQLEQKAQALQWLKLG